MKIIIAGGGISGLSAAYHLVELSRKNKVDLEVNLLESEGKLGGVISTKYHDGFIIEEGPDAFLNSKTDAIKLCKKLNLQDELLSTNKKNKKTFIYTQKKLLALPDGFYMMAPGNFHSFLKNPIFSYKGKIRALTELVIPKKDDDEDESVHSFVKRRFGTEILSKAAQPLIGGIYTGDLKKLSIKAAMSQFVEMEQKFGSVIKALKKNYIKIPSGQSGARYSLFLTLRGGMQTLIDTIGSKLPPGSVRLNSRVEGIEKNKDVWDCIVNGNKQAADAVILSTPAFASAKILQKTYPDLSQLLDSIVYASSVVVNLIFKDYEVSSLPKGFGVVVPKTEGKKTIACSLTTEKFPFRSDKGHKILRCFLGGVLNPEVIDWDDDTVLNNVSSELSEIFKLRADPEFYSIKRYRNSMPQYNLGYLELLNQIDKCVVRSRGLALSGCAYGGVGIPDCIMSGQKAAEKVFNEIYSL